MNLSPEWMAEALDEEDHRQQTAGARILVTSTPDSHDRRLTYRHVALTAEQVAEVRTDWERIGRTITETADELARHLRPLFERAIAGAHVTAAWIDELDKPPADPKARALWLRQRRNTGPNQHRRAPRQIDPRTAYR